MSDMPQQQPAASTRPDGAPVAVVDPPRVALDPALTQTPQSLVRVEPIVTREQRDEPHARGTIIVFDEERHKILTDTIMPGATAAEVEFFKLVCIRTGLDPFARQIHAVKRRTKDKRNWIDKWTFQVAIDGFRLIAERTGKYRGQEIPLFCADDAVWREVWLARVPPRASKVGVLRVDFDAPLYGVALWDEYVQTKDEYEEDEFGEARKTGNKTPAAMWSKMPTVMLGKVAEAIALRKAFPQELGGLYTDDEMAQADASAERVDDDQQRDQAAATRRAGRTRAGETAQGGTNAPAAAATPAANFTNGSAIVFPFGPLKDRGATLDAVYHVGATRTKKGKDGAPDEVIDVANQYVVNERRLQEAINWAAGKLQAHHEAVDAGADGDQKAVMSDDARKKFEQWVDALGNEIKRRNNGEWPSDDGAAAASAEGNASSTATASTGETAAASGTSEGQQSGDPTAASPGPATPNTVSESVASTTSVSSAAADKTSTTAATTSGTQGTPATTEATERARTSMDPEQETAQRKGRKRSQGEGDKLL